MKIDALIGGGMRSIEISVRRIKVTTVTATSCFTTRRPTFPTSNVFLYTATMSINPLSNPKGIKLLCELCQKPAYIQCTQCRVTYYWWVYIYDITDKTLCLDSYDGCGHCSGVEHQQTDWLGVHEKICQLLIPLRTQMPFQTSEEERENRKQWLLQKKVVRSNKGEFHGASALKNTELVIGSCCY